MMQVLQGATFIRFGLKAFLSLSFIIYTKLVILSLLYSDEWRKQKDSSALATPCMLVHVLLVFGRDSNSRERGKSQHDFQTRTPKTTKNNQKNKCESLGLPPLFFVCVFVLLGRQKLRHSCHWLANVCKLCLPIGYAYSPLHFFLVTKKGLAFFSN